MEAVAQFDDWLDGDPAGDEEVDRVDGAQRLVDLCRPRLADERRAGEGEPLRTALMQSPRLRDPGRARPDGAGEAHRRESGSTRRLIGTSSWLFALLTTATKMLRSATRRRVLEASIEDAWWSRRTSSSGASSSSCSCCGRAGQFADLGASQRASRRCQDIEKVVLRNDPDVQLFDADRTLAGDETLRALLGIRPSSTRCPRRCRHAHGDAEQRPTVPAEGTVASAAPRTAAGAVREPGAGGALSERREHRDRQSRPRTDRHSARSASPFADIQDRLARVAALYLEGGAGPLTRDVRAPTVSADDALNDLGSVLWSTTIGALRDVRVQFEAVLARERECGSSKTTEPRLMAIPGSCSLPAERVFAGLALKLSVVRSVTDAAPPEPVRSARPLRVLAVPSSPSEAPLPGAEQEVEILRQALEPIDSSIVRLEPSRTRLTKKCSARSGRSPHTCSTSWAMASSVTATATSR